MRRSVAFLSVVSLLVVTACQDSSDPVGVDPSRDVVNLIAPESGAEAEGLVFGPETFTRADGRPTTEVPEFSIVGFDGPFTLHLENGDASGMNRVTCARVILDDVTIFGPDDFPDWDRDDDDDDEDDEDDEDDADDDCDDDDDDDEDAGVDLRVVEVDLTEESVLEVRIAGRRGRFLRIWMIQGE